MSRKQTPTQMKNEARDLYATNPSFCFEIDLDIEVQTLMPGWINPKWSWLTYKQQKAVAQILMERGIAIQRGYSRKRVYPKRYEMLEKSRQRSDELPEHDQTN